MDLILDFPEIISNILCFLPSKSLSAIIISNKLFHENNFIKKYMVVHYIHILYLEPNSRELLEYFGPGFFEKSDNQKLIILRKFLWTKPPQFKACIQILVEKKLVDSTEEPWLIPMDLFARIKNLDYLKNFYNIPVFIRDIYKPISLYQAINHIQQSETFKLNFFGIFKPGVNIPDFKPRSPVTIFYGNTKIIGISDQFNYIIPILCDKTIITDVQIYTLCCDKDGTYLNYSSINRDNQYKLNLVKTVSRTYIASYLGDF